ncbi:MAG: orotidine 5'-phosphate decarboxylase [Nanoarchaeota archaeon]|nr:orotidine 5'-phosphate decarboxylase [Nanoarchaeota archaeon]MBU1005444.1 orotidine 5'-phosphate decarboxylase [Nanoarchaeota archaeon]MBU1946361.1 orotidine 5'-phosphate decarboxylase [Nanoarchaeota archaeon]
MSFIKMKRSIIPACDVPNLKLLEKLVKETCKVKGIGGYKIGFELVIPFGIKEVIKTIKKYTNLPIIYDHQKAATDIPEMGEKFMKAIKGVDSVILFPMAGPITEEKWIKAAFKERLHVIVGGDMTHKGYLERGGGFISNMAPKQIFKIAANLGVRDFVVPGNKPFMINEYRRFLESFGIKPAFYSPGLIAQGGSLTEGAKAAGEHWHAIVGRAIYNAKNMKKAAEQLVAVLEKAE